MPRVDFYVLPEGSSAQRFACKLTARARQEGHPIHIHNASREDALVLDELLWTFRDIAFLPHRLADAADDGSAVTLGWEGAHPRGEDSILINLARGIPEFAGRHARTMEVVVPDSQDHRDSRERFKRYRDELGFEMHTHKLESDHDDP